jgi:hypothetical protein
MLLCGRELGVSLKRDARGDVSQMEKVSPWTAIEPEGELRPTLTSTLDIAPESPTSDAHCVPPISLSITGSMSADGVSMPCNTRCVATVRVRSKAMSVPVFGFTS